MDDGKAGGDPASGNAAAGLPPALVDAVRADAAQRAGVAPETVRVVRAEPVTWSDGSMGCPQPGRAYTMALVPGWRLDVQAGGQLLDYHASRRGGWTWCAPGAGQPPLGEDARR